MIREVITDVLLALAVLTVAASAVGVAVVPDTYARLHYVTPAAVVAPVLVALAVFVTEGLDVNTGATLVVRTRDRVRLVLVLSVYGMLLAILFFAFQAPDVTLSELAVGAIALPLILLLAIAKVTKPQ